MFVCDGVEPPEAGSEGANCESDADCEIDSGLRCGMHHWDNTYNYEMQKCV